MLYQELAVLAVLFAIAVVAMLWIDLIWETPKRLPAITRGKKSIGREMVVIVLAIAGILGIVYLLA